MAVLQRTLDHWQDAAACKDPGVNPKLFFPFAAGYRPPLPKRDPGNAVVMRDERSICASALAVCATCPVVEPCLAQALRDRQDDGVWGGTTPTERRSMARRRPRA